MTLVIQNLAAFFQLALISLFVQNAVFARGLGVSRLTKLVTDSTTDSMVFCALLCLINVISMPFAHVANMLLESPALWYRDYIRPFVFVLCALIAFAIVLIVVLAFRPPNQKDMLAVLPMAALNTAVLGPLLISANQGYTFVQAMGFALGSGLGYAFAVLLVTEGERKMQNRNVPATFRGQPIKLIYIGILSMAIYALTGHRVSIQ